MDRETHKSYVLNITAFDSGTPPLESGNTFTLFVTVTDANDNRPEFDKDKYEFEVPEDESVGARILTFTVRDDDEGANSQLQVSILEPTFKKSFEIRQRAYQEYEMVLLEELNFENRSSYSFTMKAQDAGVPQLESSTSVRIYYRCTGFNLIGRLSSNFGI